MFQFHNKYLVILMKFNKIIMHLRDLRYLIINALLLHQFPLIF